MKAAYHESMLALYPDPEDGLGPLSVILVGRSLFIRQDINGRIPSHMPTDTQARTHEWRYQFVIGDHEIARFSPIDVEAEFDIPADHLLPWPILMEANCTRQDIVKVATREFNLRAKSAFDHGYGVRTMLDSMPKKWKSYVEPETWKLAGRMYG